MGDMPITQETIILDGGASEFAKRVRTTSSGTTARYTIDITADPVLFDFAGERLGAGPATAIRDLLSHRIKSITAQVAPSSQRRRRALERAYGAGEPYALRRFGGGRTGATPPKIGSNQLFNHSRRLADGVFVRQNPQLRAYTVNVPANRLSTSEFTEAELVEMYRRLVEHVPELRDPAQLLNDPDVRGAIRESVGDMIRQAADKNALLRRTRTRELLKLVGLRGFAGLV